MMLHESPLESILCFTIPELKKVDETSLEKIQPGTEDNGPDPWEREGQLDSSPAGEGKLNWMFFFIVKHNFVTFQQEKC